MKYGKAVRDRWLLDERVNFLNHGSFGAAPIAVLEAQTAWRERMERQPVRFLFKEAPGLLRLAAEELADFFGAIGDDLVFVDNATTGVNTVLASIALAPGDEVLTTSHAYPAVMRALEHTVKRRGARLVVADVPFPISDLSMVTAAAAAAITPRTKLAIFDYITSPTALIFPVSDLVALCRARGVQVMIDGAHAPGMIDLKLDELGADYTTGNCHKWLFAPKGCAFLHVRPERQEALHPLVISHGLGQGFIQEFDWTGTRDLSPWLCVTEAMSFYMEMGGAELRAHNHDLAIAGARILAEAWGQKLPAPAAAFGSMAPVASPVDLPCNLEVALDLNDRLRTRHSIEVPIIPFAEKIWIRISAQAYNELDQYHALAAAVLEELQVAEA